MQKITVDTESSLAKAVVQANIGEGVMLILKGVGGRSIYRGMVSKWKTSEVGDHFRTEVELEDWDSYWGDIAARRYGV